MNVFLLHYILMVIEAYIFLYNSKNKNDIDSKTELKNKKRFIKLVCLQWILISGLRADTVGDDTLNYVTNFDVHRNLPWKTIFTNFYKYYILGDESQYFEPGFVLFERIIGTFTKSHEVYKTIVAIIFMGSMGRFVYKNSEEPFLSFLLYSGLFYNMFSLTGYRQVISVAIGILWSYEYIIKRKPVQFFLLVLLAAMIHKSTLIFSVFYFMAYKKIDRRYVLIASILIIGMIILRNPLFTALKGIVGYDEYGVESGYKQKNFLFMMMVLVALSIWRYKYIIHKHKEAQIYYNGLIMSLFMIPFAMVSPTSMRLVYDFGFQLMFLLPLVVTSFPSYRDRVLVYFAIVIVFGYFVAVKTPEYTFFWQDTMRFYR